MKMLVALGGNAIVHEHEVGTIDEQFENTAATMRELVKVIQRGHSMVITHGNGPQVGNIIRRMEIAAQEVYPLPMDTCVADSQGGMGYMIQHQMSSEMAKAGFKDVRVCTVITRCLVEKSDPNMSNPTKPIGPFYSRERSEILMKERGWVMKEDAGRGWRRVVCSPRPVKVLELPAIRDLVLSGHIVVACGGGGIPVIKEPTGVYHGVDAVIDKDLASSLLARELGSELFVILTGVEKVSIDFRKPSQRELDIMTLADARRYLAEGQFPSGSMGPKIEAAIDFVENGGKEVLITSPEMILDAMDRKTGTRIVSG